MSIVLVIVSDDAVLLTALEAQPISPPAVERGHFLPASHPIGTLGASFLGRGVGSGGRPRESCIP